MAEGTTLNDILDMFRCCVLSWGVLTTMLPAFLLAGAIAAFVPPTSILKHLGAGAPPVKAYGVAALSGMLLSLCSCNIVPLFLSIMRRGAGLGPACAFLYAGPAINVLSLVFVFRIIGDRLGLWRALAVPVVAVVVGLVMALLFLREEREREAKVATQVAPELPANHARRLVLLFVGLVGAVVIGSWDLGGWPKGLALGGVGLGLVATGRFEFEREELLEWMKETWTLIKMIVPILIPAVLLIGLFASWLDIKVVYRWVGTAGARSAFTASTFGSLMYFPILTEVALTKRFLAMQMAPGAALSLLLTGPGLSLPGAILVARGIGVKKVGAFVLVVILLSATAGLLFQHFVGQYSCPCTEGF